MHLAPGAIAAPSDHVVRWNRKLNLRVTLRMHQRVGQHTGIDSARIYWLSGVLGIRPPKLCAR